MSTTTALKAALLSLRCWVPCFFLVACCCGLGRAAEARKPPSQAELDALIEQLGAADFSVREEAQVKLAAQGENARDALIKAVKSSDPEVAGAAGRLLDKINRAVIAVQLVDSTGKPIAEAPVFFNIYRRTARQPLPVRNNISVNTNAEGWALVGDLEPGPGYMIHLRCAAPGYVPAMENRQGEELKTGRLEFKIVARRFAQVKGVLIGKDRAPLADCRINLVPSQMVAYLEKSAQANAFLRRMPSVSTDAQGQFVFDQVQPGEYVVVLMRDAKVRFKSQAVRVEGEGTASLDSLATDLDPKELKQSADVLKEGGDAPADKR